MTEIATSGIVAQAFRFMEKTPTSSLNDDSEEANAAKGQYPVALKTCLGRAEWSFARKVAALSRETAVSIDPDLPYRFSRPFGMLSILQVWPGDCRWRLDADALYSDSITLTARFRFLITDETLLPGDFSTAVAAHLAFLLGPRFSMSSAIQNRNWDTYEASIKSAMRADRHAASPQRYDGRDAEIGWDQAAMGVGAAW